MTVPPDTLRSSWDGCLNARDTGGYPVGEGATRHGVLFRSDNLCRLSKAGLSEFAASGVKTVIDVRSAFELDIDPSPFALSDTIRYLNLPLQNEDDAVALGQINSGMSLLEMYRVMLKHFGKNIAAIVEAVAQADGAVVIHCHAGKDRTGLVIGLLLSVVGVDDEAVAADYAASEEYLRGALAERLAEAEPDARVGLEARLGAKAETMLGVLRTLKDDYGGATSYLLQAGVSRETLEHIHKRLIEAS